MVEDLAEVAVQSNKVTKESMAELAALTEQMTLDKKNKRRANKEDAEMDDDKMPKIQINSKPIKKTQRE